MYVVALSGDISISFDSDETPGNPASHLDQNCLTLRTVILRKKINDFAIFKMLEAVGNVSRMQCCTRGGG